MNNEFDTIPVEVFFDDFKVTHVKSPIIQQDSYYPFGGRFDSYTRENSFLNKRLYNAGSELQTDLALDVYQTDHRMYDPMLPRWWQIDPKANGLYDQSPYSFSFNNPIRYNDPKGDCPPGVDCNNPLGTMQVRQNRASNLGPGNVRTNPDGSSRPHHGHDLHSPSGTQVSSTMSGTVVSAANAGSNGYGNTVVVKTNTHPEAQPGFVGPPSGAPGPSGVPERNVYVQYSHLDGMNVATGDAVTRGQSVGTVGTTGNAQGMTGNDVHLHIQVGTEMSSNGLSVASGSTVSPNLVYNNVSFSSADPSAVQNATGVIKTVTNGNGTQTRIYQAPLNSGGSEGVLLNPVTVTGTRIPQ